MVVVLLWVLILFVALVANVGQAVNRRIALQVVADSGAYSGASKMAEGMNHIAYANGVIQDFYGLATWAWAVNTAALSTCAGFDGINNAYKGGVLRDGHSDPGDQLRLRRLGQAWRPDHRGSAPQRASSTRGICSPARSSNTTSGIRRPRWA